jgi:hypothetical protein
MKGAELTPWSSHLPDATSNFKFKLARAIQCYCSNPLARLSRNSFNVARWSIQKSPWYRLVVKTTGPIRHVVFSGFCKVITFSTRLERNHHYANSLYVCYYTRHISSPSFPRLQRIQLRKREGETPGRGETFLIVPLKGLLGSQLNPNRSLRQDR